MNHMNSILIEGFVTDAPKELARAKGDEKWGSFVKFGMVSKRLYRTRGNELAEEKLWLNVQCWGGVAESVIRWLDVSYSVRVVGRLKMNAWKGRDGKERRDIEIVASHIEFSRPKGKSGDEKPFPTGKVPGGKVKDDRMVLDDPGDITSAGEPEFIYD